MLRPPNQKTKPPNRRELTMKSVSKIVISIGLFASPLALLAGTDAQAYIEQYKGRTDLPVPIHVNTPIVDNEFAGQKVTLKFVVDADGRPQHIRSATHWVDRRLIHSLSLAIERWKFTPLYVQGRPIERTVELPIEIESLQ
jgi:hypothetical protein